MSVVANLYQWLRDLREGRKPHVELVVLACIQILVEPQTKTGVEKEAHREGAVAPRERYFPPPAGVNIESVSATDFRYSAESRWSSEIVSSEGSQCHPIIG